MSKDRKKTIKRTDNDNIAFAVSSLISDYKGELISNLVTNLKKILDSKDPRKVQIEINTEAKNNDEDDILSSKIEKILEVFQEDATNLKHERKFKEGDLRLQINNAAGIGVKKNEAEEVYEDDFEKEDEEERYEDDFEEKEREVSSTKTEESASVGAKEKSDTKPETKPKKPNASKANKSTTRVAGRK